ncbi:acetyl-CoA synthetase-like protein [Hyaloscypha bicolor E]|uniref:Acetyl-CoA synthetase-like protein n=1 Tax=Hyaloscypha bicolor E TaxID=1095630 RepID=A0A2J6T992_9HELO|nr:acetyl-CoA synthetase-like protein [Hyaloscypha bicolor E]PMD59587.1 acetyl-CoA synthetase-like protein [Hyaloscypha bicolor E]
MAPDAPFTYFTCTLGQAAEQNRALPRDFGTATEFIDLQARLHPDKPAVGFPLPTSESRESWGCNIFSFKDLQRGSAGVANSLRELVQTNRPIERQFCVGLICGSSEDFLFAWLGLMRAGFVVLLIAQPEAIAHLCKSCEVSTLFYDQVYHDLARSATKALPASLVAHILPWQQSKTPLTWITKNTPPNLNYTPVCQSTSESTAYIHHTSGTSTGLPKPIPQTHHAAVGVLPLLSGSSAATFTTTPLYHGGIADCFRAWTSNALIWLFPCSSVPITAQNIISSLSVAHQTATQSINPVAKVKYFSSVPYVLQMMAEDKGGLAWLQKMDIVGVGGAALPDGVGDTLVSNGVNLISRFGSAECGFLLSSRRNYSTDKDWQYLRLPSPGPYLRFEKQDDGSGLSELVVLKGWPHMAKTNREDGSFATSDLFEPHAEIQGAWRYHSRSDSQIILITGKKFDPAPVEDAIVAAVGEVRDCFVFGNGERVPGALIILKDDMTALVWEEEVEERVWEVIEEVNSRGQDHTRISREMIVWRREGKLEKSSKGTVLRSAAEKTFASDIKAAYAKDTNSVPISNSGSKSAKEIIRGVVIGVLGAVELQDQDDFYQHGIDSASCMRIRNQLGKHFHGKEKPLPWNIVYDCGNIERLAEFLCSWQRGEEVDESETKEMLDLVDRYSVLCEPATKHLSETFSSSNNGVKGEVVILTGATGALGSHILSQLLASPSVTQVYCLVRPKDTETASERVLATLKQRFLLALSKSSLEKLQSLPAKLEEENLGFKMSVYEQLRDRVSTIIHAAWPVNFSLPLRAFEHSLQGLQNLLQLSNSSSRSPNFVFCSSTAAVLGSNHPGVIPETVSTSPEDSDTLGYSKSKWVAETICSRVAESCNKESRFKVLRIGQLTGDTEHGVWNMSEAYPLMLSTLNDLGCLPRINDKLSWLPLDVAANAVCEIALADKERSRASTSRKSSEVYNVVNNDTTTSFMDLLGWLKEMNKDPFEILESREWSERLEKMESHPAKALLGLWRPAFEGSAREDLERVATFDTTNAKEVSQTMRGVRPVDEKLFAKIWKWVEGEMAKKT